MAPGAFRLLRVLALVFPLAAAACANDPVGVSATSMGGQPAPAVTDYVIGPGDALSVFVYRSPELSMSVPVRPDGRISLPLVADIAAAGRTPVELAKDIEERLKEYIREPNVTVMVTSFVGLTSRLVRIVGEAAQPRSLPFREGMTVLDALIESGGLTRFAAGNRARLIRREGEAQQVITLRLADLLRDGDFTQDIPLRPGDTVVIPQGWF